MTAPVDARTAELLAPTVEDAVRMPLGEIEAGKQLSDESYRAGHQRGYVKGRQVAVCERCAYPLDGGPS